MMSERLSDAALTDLEDAYAAATKGPWRVDRPGRQVYGGYDQLVGTFEFLEDATLVALTHPAVRELIAGVLDLRFTLDTERAKVDRLQRECDGWQLIARGRNKLLTCYRLGTQRGAPTALSLIERGQKLLEATEKEGEGD